MNSITPMPRIVNQEKTRQKKYMYTYTYAVMFLVLHVSIKSDNRSVL